MPPPPVTSTDERLRDDLAAERTAAAVLRESLGAADSELALLRREAIELHARIDAASTEQARSEAALHGSRSEIEMLLRACHAGVAELQQMSNEIGGSTVSNVAIRPTEIAELADGDVAAMASATSRLRADLLRLRDELERAESDKNTAREELKAARQMAEAANLEATELKLQVRSVFCPRPFAGLEQGFSGACRNDGLESQNVRPMAGGKTGSRVERGSGGFLRETGGSETRECRGCQARTPAAVEERAGGCAYAQDHG